ncbi:hypothetical protein [Arenimonas sp. SCN 70-307]|uniref:hypothetical protein n=1 Tax=Arenimonas sp. SCN 70-307 TaxID=1660089 RepID=UPI0025BE7D53|nr:hypothetical protein [Arenimonas sp. SCN 70-307]
MVLVRALRYLYEELKRSSGADEVSPWRLVRAHFDNAVQELLSREKPYTSYRVANYLQYVAAKVDSLGLAPVAMVWKHGVERPEGAGGLKANRVGKRFRERRERLLLSDEVLYAVAALSNAEDLDDRDLVCQRVVDLLFCCGFRVNEALALFRDLMVEEAVRDDLGQLALGADGNPVSPHFGLRYVPEKGGREASRIKWVPTELVPIARRAVTDLLRVTSPYADRARFAFENPGRAQFGEPWDSLPSDALVSLQDVAGMLGFRKADTARIWIESNVRAGAASTRGESCMKGDVEGAVSRLIHGASISFGGDLGEARVHELLAVVPRNYFHSRKASINGTAVSVTDQNISDYLCGRSSSSGSAKSIFERRGLRDSSGAIIKIRTHQFRHFLDTVAAEGGVPELVRARWMGRKDLSQNSAYDHETGISLARKVRQRLVDGTVEGPIGDYVRAIPDPVARGDLASDLIRGIHRTQLGRCFHDWAASPCPEHEACWGCLEHLVVKADSMEMAEAERQLLETKQALAAAEIQKSEGTYGAGNWEKAHRRKLIKLERILAVHKDASVPDGTLVHLAASSVGDGSPNE